MVARTTTGNMAQARKLADSVLEHKQTLRVDITVQDGRGFEACQTLARGIQKSFAAMRSVDRDREANKAFGAGLKNTGLWIESKYDKVSCTVLALEGRKGYRVQMSYEDSALADYDITFADGSAPRIVPDRDMDALFARIAADITQVAPADVVACAEHLGTTGDDIPNLWVGGFVEIQRADDWMMSTFMPWWREQRTGQQQPVQPTEENAVGQQQGA